MTREEAIYILKCVMPNSNMGCGESDEEIEEALMMAVEALEQKPYEKFKSVKDHIYKLASDYKCWDIRLTQDEALELCHILEREPCEDMGEVSDGYHTFNQLYHQRAVLFATIVNSNKDKAWKSFKHSDGKYCFDSNGEWFIVGVDTPQGSYTYHYEKKYWDMFDCKELQCSKEWDGHTEEDVTRLLSLEQEPILDKIRAELHSTAEMHEDGGYYLRDEWIDEYFDKYKAESEG